MKNFLDKNRQIRQEVLQLTLPVIIEQTFITLLGVINAMMAGHISKEAAAAIGMIDSLNSIFVTVFSSLAVGGTVVVAHYTGKNSLKDANEAAKQSIYSGMFLALLIAIFTGIFRYPIIYWLFGAAEPAVIQLGLIYFQWTLPTYPLIAFTSIACGVLRGAGNTKSPAQVVTLMNGINILLSYILIFGISMPIPFFPTGLPSLGVHGAALGIGCARLVGALLLIHILVRGSVHLRVDRIFHFKLDWEKTRAILNIGIPASLESLLFSVGKLITQTFIVAMGTVAVVSNYIGMSLHSLLMIPGGALGIAATSLVGQYMGRGDASEASKALWYLNKLSVFCLIGLNLACFPLMPWFTGLYTTNQEIIALSTMLLRITAFIVGIWPFSFLLPAGLKGAGDVRFTLIISTISMWLFRISLGYLLGITLNWGVLGVWIGMYGDWAVRGLAFWIRFKNDRWQKQSVIAHTADS